MSQSSAGKSVLVVGGARGIGRVTVELLMAGGDRPLVLDRDQSELGRLQVEWGGRAALFSMDLTRRDDVARALEWVRSQGPLDAVVMSAAIHSTYPIEHVPDDVIDRVLEVNLVAHIRFVRDVIPLIRPGGRIVAVSSVSAGVGIPMEAIYSASKAGLELFYECLSLELAYKDIKCAIIQPGNVNTGFNETGNEYKPVGNTFIDELYRKILERTDSRFGIPPQRVASAIVKSIKSRKPKLCVLVGANAIKAHWAKRLLGRDLALKVLKKVMCG